MKNSKSLFRQSHFLGTKIRNLRKRNNLTLEDLSARCIKISAEEAQNILREAPGVMLIDKRENGGYITPIECVGDFATFISRIRQDSTIDNGLNLWCVSDNLRKGAALNAVQIAELLGRECLKKG